MRPDSKGTRGPAPPKSPGKRLYDRHSGTGNRGLPKKGGAGGKGTWGRLMDEDGPAAYDGRDVNYESPDEFALGDTDQGMPRSASD
mmetsp:Transcript_8448/g.25389  ORF Transcript_8448/g.25389 Transcript_8448/m.25389 type:complete len:86 (-) Transcript_8448:201-458(-)